MEPAPEEGMHGTGAQSVANALERGWVGARAEAVVECFEPDACLLELALCPTVAIQPEPNRKWSVGVGLPEGRAPLGIPQIEIEVVDEDHLTAPLHMRMAGFLLALLLPRTPGGCLLLSDANEDDLAFAALLSRGAQQWLDDLLLVVTLGEVANGNAVRFGPAVDSGDVGFADLAKGRRRWDRKAALPIQEQAHLADRLELGDIRLQKQAINRAAGQRDVVAQQRGIIGHDVALLVWNARRLHRQRGPHVWGPLYLADCALLAKYRCSSGEAPSCGGSPRKGARSVAEQRLAAGGAAPPTRTSAV